MEMKLGLVSGLEANCGLGHRTIEQLKYLDRTIWRILHEKVKLSPRME